MAGKNGRKGMTRGKSLATNDHNSQAYWDKLRQEFQQGHHENSGAYCASAQPKRTPLVFDERAHDHFKARPF